MLLAKVKTISPTVLVLNYLMASLTINAIIITKIYIKSKAQIVAILKGRVSKVTGSYSLNFVKIFSLFILLQKK